jgi:peptidoglycan LD-endopeptidase LytH
VSATLPPRSIYSWLLFAGSLGFLGGMLVMAALVTMFPDGAALVDDGRVEAASPKIEVKPPAIGSSVPAQLANPIEELRRRNLELPVQGMQRNDLRDTFTEARGSARKHEALDVLAPRHTPVLAVEDGTIAKLFFSDAGGITIYQFDATQAFCYYYAHLQRYADGLKEGAAVRRGEVIGYVGTTGNAPRETPHLHFAIFKLTNEKRWWEGTPIDPYSVLK